LLTFFFEFFWGCSSKIDVAKVLLRTRWPRNPNGGFIFVAELVKSSDCAERMAPKVDTETFQITLVQNRCDDLGKNMHPVSSK
jgi:hypothetical protein